MSQNNEAERIASIRYEPDENPPTLLAIGLGIQLVVLCIGGVIFTPTIIFNAAGLDDPAYLAWLIFACLLVTAITTAVQALKVGRFGAGYPLFMGTSGTFIAISVSALVNGGPMMFATLVVVSSLVQFTLSSKLALVRKIVTPVVSGTVIMLIPVTVMPIVFDLLTQIPEGGSTSGAAITGGVTLFSIVVLGLLGKGLIRLWAPVLGVLIGSIVGSFFGLFDSQKVIDASWIGLPLAGFPEMNFDFGVAFWSLLPAFVIVTIVGAVETMGDAVAIQEVSHRKPKAADYRVVQSAVATDGIGNLLSGLLATVPNTTYSSSIAVAELTGVASRRVGFYAALAVLCFALMPKFQSVILGVPNVVVAAYLLVLLAMLFVVGMRFIVRSGLDYRKVIIVGVSFWLGVGFQNQLIFADELHGWWREFLANGMTAGGIAALLMTGVMSLFSPRRKKFNTLLTLDATREIDEFIQKFGTSIQLSPGAVHRLSLVSEETVTNLLARGASDDDDAAEGSKRSLQVSIHREDREVVLEFVATSGAENIEDKVLLMENAQEATDLTTQEGISLQLIRELSSQVVHQQYHETDCVTVRVVVA